MRHLKMPELGAIPDGTLFVQGRELFRVRRAIPATQRRAPVKEGTIFDEHAVTALGPVAGKQEPIEPPFEDVVLGAEKLPENHEAPPPANDNEIRLAVSHYAD
jgi:hypothetical protein